MRDPTRHKNSRDNGPTRKHSPIAIADVTDATSVAAAAANFTATASPYAATAAAATNNLNSLYSAGASPPKSPTRQQQQQQQTNNRAPPCRYYPLGQCIYGDYCRFTHDDTLIYDDNTSTTTTTAAASSFSYSRKGIPCRFFYSGYCRNGDNCPFSHGEAGDEPNAKEEAELIHQFEEMGICQPCDSLKTADQDTVDYQNNRNNLKKDAKLEGEKIDYECSICFENIVESRKRFGLLLNCSHVFCLDCIMTWRDAYKPDNNDNNNNSNNNSNSNNNNNSNNNDTSNNTNNANENGNDTGPIENTDNNNDTHRVRSNRSRDEAFTFTRPQALHTMVGITNVNLNENASSSGNTNINEPSDDTPYIVVGNSIINENSSNNRSNNINNTRPRPRLRNLTNVSFRPINFTSNADLLEDTFQQFLDTIQNQELNSNPQFTKKSTHSCPICRIESKNVIPSLKYLEKEEKEAYFEEYKRSKSNIPCKHFNGSLGSCPFGSECYYAHFNKSGVDVKQKDFKKSSTNRQSRTMRGVRNSSSRRYRASGRGAGRDDDYGDEEDDDIFFHGNFDTFQMFLHMVELGLVEEMHFDRSFSNRYDFEGEGEDDNDIPMPVLFNNNLRNAFREMIQGRDYDHDEEDEDDSLYRNDSMSDLLQRSNGEDGEYVSDWISDDDSDYDSEDEDEDFRPVRRIGLSGSSSFSSGNEDDSTTIIRRIDGSSSDDYPGSALDSDSLPELLNRPDDDSASTDDSSDSMPSLRFRHEMQSSDESSSNDDYLAYDSESEQSEY